MSAKVVMIGYMSQEIQYDTTAFLNDWTPQATCEFIDNTNTNYPLTTLWNKIVHEANTDYVFLLNADVWVSPGWILPLLRAFQDPLVAVVGPGSNEGPQTVDIGMNHIPIPPTRGWLERASEAALCRYAWQSWPKEIHGFCYGISKRIWRRLDGFDEAIPFYGNETDYNNRARDNGFQVLKCPDSYVFHQGKHSFNQVDKDVKTLLVGSAASEQT